MKTESINFKTVYNKIRSMPPTERRETLSGRDGEHWLSLLTPTQFALLFPDYYKKPLPDVGLTLAASGGVVLGGRSPTVTSATPWSIPTSSGGSGGTTYSGGGSGSTATPVPPDPNKVLEDKLKAAGVVLPEPEIPAGAIDRTRFAKELEANPQVKVDLLSLATAETGGQGPEAQQRWMETVFNRAYAKNKSIADIINPNGVPGEVDRNGRQLNYWPTNQKRPQLTKEQIEEKSKLLDGVLKGSNLSNYATDNASNLPGNPLGSRREAKLKDEGREDQGKWVNGEYFYVDTHYADEMRRLRKETEERVEKVKIGSETGSTEESGLKPRPDAPAPEPVLRPEGMNDELSKYFDSLSPARQKALIDQLDKIGGIEKANEMAKDAHKNASGIPQIPTATPDNSKKYPAGEERFYREGGRLVSSSGVKLNEKLVNVLKAASKDLPDGYHIKMFSGADSRSTGTRNHPGGVAIDLKIVDGQGRELRDRGFGEGHRIYEQLAQSMKIRGQEMYPDTDYIWGGAWTVAGGDRMHYQIVDPEQKVFGASRNSGAYNFETGIDREFWAGKQAADQFMTKEELRAYKETIRKKILEEKQSATPTIGSETGSTEESGLKPRIRKDSDSEIPPVPMKQRGITSGHPNESVPQEEEPEVAPNTTNPRAPGYKPSASSPAAPTVTPAPAPTPPGVSSPKVTPKEKPSENVIPPVDVPQNQSSAQPAAPTTKVSNAEMGAKVEAHSPSAQRAYAQTNFEPKHYQGGAASVSKMA